MPKRGVVAVLALAVAILATPAHARYGGLRVITN